MNVSGAGPPMIGRKVGPLQYRHHVLPTIFTPSLRKRPITYPPSHPRQLRPTIAHRSREHQRCTNSVHICTFSRGRVTIVVVVAAPPRRIGTVYVFHATAGGFQTYTHDASETPYHNTSMFDQNSKRSFQSRRDTHIILSDLGSSHSYVCIVPPPLLPFLHPTS
ncbi:hypothetical protein FA13DRAFT_617642 [Coprinellus micaceus]|uniref:Uncharacterized protein n=1 Tax=Coprinellus micaceus TaxID=71717 RepID=A0A4Y7T6L2_COPMI|nr:hypothetical protein FA13DRAFT_617642 [Coprinellus micaceus]